MRKIQHIEIASMMGVSPAGDLDDLVNGKCTARIASRVGVSSTDVEDFIKGEATWAMMTRLGLKTLSATEELARVAERDGAIGIILGILAATA